MFAERKKSTIHGGVGLHSHEQKTGEEIDNVRISTVTQSMLLLSMSMVVSREETIEGT